MQGSDKRILSKSSAAVEPANLANTSSSGINLEQALLSRVVDLISVIAGPNVCRMRSFGDCSVQWDQKQRKYYVELPSNHPQRSKDCYLVTPKLTHIILNGIQIPQQPFPYEHIKRLADAMEEEGSEMVRLTKKR